MRVRHADYVIVGAGSAGCVLAARLTEDPGVSVILIEAGGRGRHPTVVIPAAFSRQFRTRLDWDYNTEPEPHCDGRSLYVPRGKGLGGSSAMNAMLYVRGRPLDYDRWREQGATGWGWKDVRPYFLRAEDNQNGAGEHHAVGGPLRVESQRSPRRLTHRFLAAAAAAGVPPAADYNGLTQDGAAIAQVTQRNGRRWSAADAYLRPAMSRPNLTVLTGGLVLRVELEGARATGVRLGDRWGREQSIAAGREVLLSAGAIASPQLLMLSGVGPAEHLRELGITPAVDAPGVGRNLQDHPCVGCVWDATAPESLADAETPQALAEWLLRRSGPLTSPVAEAVAFVRTRPGLPAPDIEYHFGPAYFVDHGFSRYDGHAFSIGPVLLCPRSRGWLTLRSSDPTAKPRITTNSLGEREDVAALVAGVKLAREIAACAPLACVAGTELFPGAAAHDDAGIEADLRRRVELLYHPAGTCRMGSDEGAVVDPQLCVRGVDGLRVVDASIMPVIPGANLNAPTIMVAERAVDLIRKDPRR
ncbi:MAG: GMC family oxidoreductase [Solirubrobacteraceae bacterium]